MDNQSGSDFLSSSLTRTLSLDIARVTEGAAVAAARLRGRGDERQADAAAVEAMRREIADLPIAGKVVIGEGERDEVSVLYVGEELGRGGPPVDIAVDPLEGTTLCAKSLPGRACCRGRRGKRRPAQRARHLHGEDRHRSGL